MSQHPEWLRDKVADRILDTLWRYDGDDPKTDLADGCADAALDAVFGIGGHGWLSDSGPPWSIYGLDELAKAHTSRRVLVVPLDAPEEAS